ncbi:NnrS family protein [Aliiroseovarius sp. KMU-50]|uniref:NnrS family protein n=1 Tax=Aliiroseovarius salicola TaxID=3009082 RepID=A0ABT4VYG1_9RHOB|nr:NnrS family protein [Aliiroseovarius sp. KMU-50]MDA5092612.1 NnrS family protein [Aliiroseovarius sp. KMU-50]
MILLTGAYRLFFPAAGLFAGLAIPLWLVLFMGAAEGMSDPFLWHQHEMLFGYLPAAAAGFLFTAIPNWTRRDALPPVGIALLFALWLAGRVGMFVDPEALSSQIIALLFLPVVAGLALGELVLANNRRNFVVAGVIFALALAQATFLWMDADIGLTAGFALSVILMVHIGGRVTPAFSRNWLKKRGAPKLPASFGTIDQAAITLTVAAAISWVALGATVVTGALAAAATASLALRLSRWCGLSVWSEPLLFAQHAAYAWLVISMALLAMAGLGDLATGSQIRHAIGAGAIGSMTVIVMLRAILGHSGRPIEGRPIDIAIFLCLHMGAAMRVSADWFGTPIGMIHGGGTLWALGMVLFAIRAFPIAIAPRL